MVRIQVPQQIFSGKAGKYLLEIRTEGENLGSTVFGAEIPKRAQVPQHMKEELEKKVAMPWYRIPGRHIRPREVLSAVAAGVLISINNPGAWIITGVLALQNTLHMLEESNRAKDNTIRGSNGS